MSDFPRWPVTYYINGVADWQDEGPPAPLSIGTGVIYPKDYRRYRVEDIWVSYDHHGRFDDGVHVFLVDVTRTPDDRPGSLAPDYFSE